MPIFLEDLGEDVALLFFLSATSGLCCLLAVNAFFRRLTSSKQLWIALIEDLAERRLVDIPHSRFLIEHSTEELISLVKRTVLGPATWSLPHKSPTVAEEICLPPSLITADQVELLFGGRHVLVHRDSPGWCLELWTVGADSPFWTRTQAVDVHAAEIIDGGRSVIIVTVSSHLKVIQVDLETAEFKDLLNVTLPANCSPSDNIRPVISGDLLAQALYWYGALDDDHGTFAAILLIDWRSQKYVLFWYSRNEPIIFLIVYQVGDVHQGRVFRPLQYATLLSYRFSIAASSGNMVGWVRMSSSLAQLDVTSVSYAGYGMRWVGPQIFKLVDASLLRRACAEGSEEKLQQVSSPENGVDSTDMVMEVRTRQYRGILSPYSHALVHLQGSSMMLTYYV
ncbi:hypothetical protein B0H13DRAFT_2427494 [Mycena leptocephala]|nr:hypothetical protein B0H13DRAFT_2427494 [Mycena leptocephala]